MSPPGKSIPIFDPLAEVHEFRAHVDDAIRSVIDSGQFILGPNVSAFEQEIAAYLDVPYAIGVNSGTDALVIALRALGIGQGDEVVTTPFTFFATAEAIEAVGATPVFADIDPTTYNLDAAAVEAALTRRTRALLPVHLYGNPCDMHRLGAVARTHGLLVVEDVAQAMGATFRGQRVGSIGDAAGFSFFPTKNLGGFGDGGLVATRRSEAAEQARMLRAHGSKRKYYNEQIGYNSRLDELQAAVLRVKLPHLEERNRQRRDAAARYARMLAAVEGVVLPVEMPGGTHVYHQYTIRITGGRRDDVRQRLHEDGVSTMVYYPHTMTDLPMYRERPRCPHAERASKEALSIPIWPGITEDDQQRVVETLAKAVASVAPRWNGGAGAD